MCVLDNVDWAVVTFDELDLLLRLHAISESSSIDECLQLAKITPLCAACKLNREDLVSVLLYHGACANKTCFSSLDKRALHFACDHSQGNLGLVRKILDATADINALDRDGNTGLHLACTQGNIKVVELLLQRGAAVHLKDIDGETALVRACLAGEPHLVKILLTAGSDPNASGGLSLYVSVRNCFVDIVKLLITAGADVLCGTYLSDAIEFDHIEMMKVLHDFGVDVNRANVVGMSPLHMACYCQTVSAEAVSLLLAWGADVHAYTSTRTTALHYACAMHDVHKVQLLLAYGANPNIQDSQQFSPLTRALKCPSYQTSQLNPQAVLIIVQLLLATGARLLPESFQFVKSSIAVVCVHKKYAAKMLDILDWHTTQPASLQSICRIRIREAVATPIDQNMTSLPLPERVISYLQLDDVLEQT